MRVSVLVRKPARRAYRLYYRYAYGRSFPGAEALEGRVARFESRVGRGDTPAAKSTWEQKYTDGRWDFMRELHELPRYAVIAALVHRVAPAGRILDVGCGEGLLVDHLRPLGYGRYTGTDISEAAISAATKARADDRTTFEAGDAETYAITDDFDLIVFNESLAYLREPLGTIARYQSRLAPGGIFVVSMFVTPRHEAIARLLLPRFRVLEEFTVGNRLGTSRVKLLEPLSAGGS
jgi:SAM-dependent methyltransferase